MAMTGGTAKLVKSGTPSGWPSSIKLYVYYKVVSQSVANNTTTLSLGMYVTTPSGWWFGPWTDFNGSYVGTATSGSNCKSFDGGVDKVDGTHWLVQNQQVTVTHDSDGTKSVKIYWKWGVNSSWGGFSSNSGSFSVTLTTIPRASAITSAAAVTLGNACNVKWTPYSASFRYKLKFSLGDWSYTTGVIHPNTTAAYTYTGYTIPMAVANQLPTARTGTMTVTLTTYSDSTGTTKVGDSSSKTFTVTVPDNKDTKPTVSMSLAPVGALSSNFAGLYVQGMTKVKATITATEKYGASISSYLMRVDGIYSDEDDNLTSAYFVVAGKRPVYGYATDVRGHTGETIQYITVLPYQEPKIVNVTAERCDADGNISDSGTYLKIHAERSYSTVVADGVQKNFCEIRYRYSNGSSYSSWVTILARDSLASNAVTTGALLGGALSTQASYTVQVRAIDDVGRYADTYIVVPTEKVYWHRDGARNALALGKYNERDDGLDMGWDIYMNSNRITGLPTPTAGSDAVPKSYVDQADTKMEKSLSAQGWYKLGTISGEMCGVVTVTVGGIFVNNQASPSMVDIATQYSNARAFLRMASLADNQISKIGVIKESTTVYGVYAYYNSTAANTVKINIHVHMGAFTSAAWAASGVAESDMLAVITLKQ